MKFKLGDKVKIVKITDKAPYEDAIGKTAKVISYDKKTNMYFLSFGIGFTVPEIAGIDGRFETMMVFYEDELEVC